MFHFMGFPFKVSYFLAALWFLDYLLKKNRNQYLEKEFKTFSVAILTIIMCGCLGEMFFSTYWTIDSYEPFLRSNVIYLLTIFAFGLGLASSRFNISWLVPVLFISLILNFAFIFLKSKLPSPLIELYYGKSVIEDFARHGLTSAEEILSLARPRGLFSNPNGSAFLVNIISLFIYLGIKHRLCPRPHVITLFLIIILPVILSTLLASRGEFVVSLILAFLHYKVVYSKPSHKNGKSDIVILNLLLVSVPLGLALYISQKVDLSEIQTNINRTISVLEIIENTNSTNKEASSLSGLARPFLTFVEASERYKLSPIFGTGYSMVPGHEYFSVGTDYYHNDWFRLLVTSGIIGFLTMLWIVYRFVFFLGWPVLIPFILPGIVNTFLLNIPAVMFFFFMVGNMRSSFKRLNPLNMKQ